ncbi:predicted protein [Streptomyces albidoflavus]|nr:predicted protein [Streptomyces albidoflavus]
MYAAGGDPYPPGAGKLGRNACSWWGPGRGATYLVPVEQPSTSIPASKKEEAPVFFCVGLGCLLFFLFCFVFFFFCFFFFFLNFFIFAVIFLFLRLIFLF